MKNIERLKQYNDADWGKNNLAYSLYSDAEKEGRTLSFMVDTDKFELKKGRLPELYIIGKSCASDETVYVVCWKGFSRRVSGGNTTTYKMYTRKQIDWFNFKKVKQIA